MKTTHLAHHRRFPNSDDPEAYVADMPLGRALLEGPIYPYRLWTWTRKHHPEMVRRVSLEALGHALLGSGATALLPISRVPFLYAAAMFVGCSLFPAISVNLLHHIDGDNPLTWTRTVGGTVLPFITVGSGYHLEHHLYPRVPSPNYKHLARRLRPVLASRGVTGYRLTAHRTPSPTGLIA